MRNGASVSQDRALSCVPLAARITRAFFKVGILSRRQQRRNKSLFASFSSEKEDSSFFEKKEAKKLYLLAA
jgi:hypothetical protein